MCFQNNSIIVSACLVGLNTRYSGECKPNGHCQELLKKQSDRAIIPVCPEQLGGLSTPREAANIIGGTGFDVLDNKAKVITKNGTDVTIQFIRGAEQVLHICQIFNSNEAWLKSRSPSCAVCGTIGVTSALLKRNGITLMEY